MTAPSFEKIGTTADGSPVEQADLGNIQRMEFDLEFQQKKAKGMLGGLRDRLQQADPDLVAVAFKDTTPVDYVEPKEHSEIFDGAARSLGDARRAGTETVALDVARLAERNRDITGFAVAASCADGFGRVAGIVCHVYDVTSGQRVHVTACRFDVTKPHITSGLFGALVAAPGGGWVFRTFNEYGTGDGWEDVARSARTHMTP